MSLLRFVRHPDGGVHFDVMAKLPGRGAYTCVRATCLERACEKGAFRRAFDAPVLLTSLTDDGHSQTLSERTRAVLASEAHRSLSLLFVQRALTLGRERAVAAAQGADGFFIRAADLAENSARELEALRGDHPVVRFSDKASLAAQLGSQKPVGICFVSLSGGAKNLAARFLHQALRHAALGGDVEGSDGASAPLMNEAWEMLGRCRGTDSRRPGAKINEISMPQGNRKTAGASPLRTADKGIEASVSTP